MYIRRGLKEFIYVWSGQWIWWSKYSSTSHLTIILLICPYHKYKSIFSAWFILLVPVHECIKQRKCGTYTASVRQSNSQCFCSAVECPEENRVERGVVRTYTTAGHAGALTPIDCDGTWSPWSSCDGERQTRTFSVTTEPEYGGQECPVPVEYRTCYLPNTDCVGYWSPYSAINGYENRTFRVTREPVRFGLSCLSPQKGVPLPGRLRRNLVFMVSL